MIRIKHGWATVALKAKKKELDIMSPSDLGLNYEARLSVLSVDEPEERQGGIKVSNVDELIDKLKNEAKVL